MSCTKLFTIKFVFFPKFESRQCINLSNNIFSVFSLVYISVYYNRRKIIMKDDLYLGTGRGISCDCSCNSKINFSLWSGTLMLICKKIKELHAFYNNRNNTVFYCWDEEDDEGNIVITNLLLLLPSFSCSLDKIKRTKIKHACVYNVRWCSYSPPS